MLFPLYFLIVFLSSLKHLWSHIYYFFVGAAILNHLHYRFSFIPFSPSKIINKQFLPNQPSTLYPLLPSSVVALGPVDYSALKIPKLCGFHELQHFDSLTLSPLTSLASHPSKTRHPQCSVLSLLFIFWWVFSICLTFLEVSPLGR